MARRDQRTGCLSSARQLLSRYCILVYGRLYGNYLTCCYVFVKLLYCVNAVGQLFLLDVFLGYDFHGLGVHVIRHLLFGEEWIPSKRPVTFTHSHAARRCNISLFRPIMTFVSTGLNPLRYRKSSYSCFIANQYVNHANSLNILLPDVIVRL